MDNPAVVFRSIGRVEVADQPMPVPREGEVLIETRCSLISAGTEARLLAGKFGLSAKTAEPLLGNVGYSNVGVVVDVGPSVDRGLLGQRVASRSFHAAYVTCLANEVAGVWRSGVMPIPESVSDEQAAFTSLALTTINGVRRASVSIGESVAVIGLGTIGQLAVRLCSFAGARPIFAINRSPSRLRYLPTAPFIIGLHGSGYRETLVNSSGGRPIDIVIEAAGDAGAIAEGAALLRPQGRLVVLGSSDTPATYDFHDLCNLPSISIIGAHVTSHPPVSTPDRPWSAVANGRFFLECLARGDLRVDDLVSHRVAAENAAEAYDLIRGKTDVMGVVLRW